MPEPIQTSIQSGAAVGAANSAASPFVETVARQFEFVERHAKLWKAGHYPEYDLNADAAYVDRLISASKTLARIPLEIAMLSGDPDAPHGTGDDRIEVGDVLPASLHRDGDWLCGTVRIPKVIDDRLNAPTKRKLSVQFNPKTFQLTHTAIVPLERCKGASFSETEFAFAESGDVAAEAKPDAPAATPEAPPKQDEQVAPEQDLNQAGSMAKCLEILSGLGLKLPDDTTEKNLRERIEVAGDAVLNAQQPDSNASPNLNREVRQPQPIAMSQTSEVIMPTDTVAGVAAPDFTFADDRPAEVDIPFSQKQFIRTQYRDMVNQLIRTRRITSGYANKWLLPLFGKNTDEFSFSVVQTAKGPTAQHKMLDYLLAAFADTPEGSILNGPTAVVDSYGKGGKRKKGSQESDINFALVLPEEPVAEPSGGQDASFSAEVNDEMTVMAMDHVRGGGGATKPLQAKAM